MRIAFISDVHGNLVSLDAVLSDINRRRIDQIICLGDVATLGPQPRRCIRRLRSLDCPMVMGNHDALLLDPGQSRTYMDVDWFEDAVAWCADQLTVPDFDFLRTFQPLLTVTLAEGVELLCFHGSPRSNTDNILATTPEGEVAAMLAGYRADVMVGGHTHVQMVRRFEGRPIVNVGSVGMPFVETPFSSSPQILPWAEYAIIAYENGRLSIQLQRVPIDLEAVKEGARHSDLPAADTWIGNWVA